MDKKIKVYLQYPWKFPDSPYYKYLIDNPPEEIEYQNISNQKGVIINKRFFWFSNFLKRNIRRVLNGLNASMPNAHLSPNGNYDLIHCAHCLSKNKNKVWVADMEGEWSMYVNYNGHMNPKKVNKIFLRENCKKILPWTNHTSKAIERLFPDIKEKLEVVYPAVPVRLNKKKLNKKEIVIIFSGRYFYDKGGLHALETIDRLTKKYNFVRGIVNSDVPKEILQKYEKNKKIKFYKLIPQKELFELYSNSDIFLYPGYSDSFGFGFLEAMSFGLPIVTMDGYARKEIVSKEVGFVINRPENFKYEQTREINNEIINNLVECISLLINNKKLREKMAKKCLEEIKNGKFSIKERNKKIKKIYIEALK
jgi:glycosyltransferase involved in cell wall biosynthesis